MGRLHHAKRTKMMGSLRRTVATRMRAQLRKFKLGFKTVWTSKGSFHRLKFTVFLQDLRRGYLRLLRGELSISAKTGTISGARVRMTWNRARGPSLGSWTPSGVTFPIIQSYFNNCSSRSRSTTILFLNWALLTLRSGNNARWWCPKTALMN